MDQFTYERRVAFSDTDAMGIVHHANYLRFCEEARSAWIRERGLSELHYPNRDCVLAVVRYQVWHMRPSRYEDLLKVKVQVQKTGLKIRFQYVIYKGEDRIAEAETVHVPTTSEIRIVRLDERVNQMLEKEPWTETLLSNS